MNKLVEFLTWYYKADIPAETLRKKYAHPASKYMPIDGMDVHYRDEGNMNDPVPIVLLHGTSSSLHTWDECTKELIKTRRVIRFDLPAFGLTGPHPKADYALNTYAGFITKVLDKLKVDKVCMAGNSFGGSITFNYALNNPDRVEKIALLNSDGVKFKIGMGAIGFVLMYILGHIPILKYLLYYCTPEDVVKASVKGVYGDPSKITPAIFERYRDFTLRAGNRKALADRLVTKYADNTERLKDIKLPTLLIWGDLDAVVPVKVSEVFDKEIPNSKLEILKGVGHVPMEEVPEKVTPLIQDFFA